MEQIWKIIDIVNWGKTYFASKNIESPRLNIELLLCKTLNCERINLYTNFDLPMSKLELTETKKMILRRAKGEPLQYILGKTSFMGFEIILTNDVLIPRPETEELVELILNHNNYSNPNILDIGTGSGCISIALAKKHSDSQIVAVDLSYKTLEIAKKNALINNVSNSIHFFQKDILSDFDFDKKFDIIVSNPPYISLEEYENHIEKELYFEPRIALTDNADGLKFYKKYASEFYKILNENGFFMLEFGYNQKEDILKMFKDKYEIKIYKDLNEIERFIFGQIKRV